MYITFIHVHHIYQCTSHLAMYVTNIHLCYFYMCITFCFVNMSVHNTHTHTNTITSITNTNTCINFNLYISPLSLYITCMLADLLLSMYITFIHAYHVYLCMSALSMYTTFIRLYYLDPV